MSHFINILKIFCLAAAVLIAAAPAPSFALMISETPVNCVCTARSEIAGGDPTAFKMSGHTSCLAQQGLLQSTTGDYSIKCFEICSSSGPACA